MSRSFESLSFAAKLALAREYNLKCRGAPTLVHVPLLELSESSDPFICA